jgi:parallel beta-helix repeat protein
MLSDMKKMPTTFALILVLSFTLVSLPQIEVVKAESTIYIRADGTIEGTDRILRDGNVYTFTGNIDGRIVVERYNIVVEGGGYTLQGTGVAIDGPARNIGIDLAWMRNVTIRNVAITSFDYGISISNAFNNVITGNNITNNGYGIEVILYSSGNSIYENNITANIKGGIWLDFANGNAISSNQITDNKPKGIWISFSSNESISANYVANNSYGIFIDRSSYTTLRNNTMVDNEQNFSVEGPDSNHFVNDVDVSNTVDEKPIYYWVNQHGKTVLSDAGYVALVNCTNVTVQNLNIFNNRQGILLAYTTNTTINKNTITNTTHAIRLQSSSQNTIIENNLTNSSSGLYFYDSSNNTLSENNIKNNLWGINFDYFNSNNSVVRNLIENNTYGISVMESPDNIFLHNTLLNNSKQVTDLVIKTQTWLFDPSINIWDNGEEGNYWSNYNGTDNNGDGIGDTPYVIDQNNQDNYPLAEPYIIPEFPSWIILPLLIIITFAAIIYKKRLPKKH